MGTVGNTNRADQPGEDLPTQRYGSLLRWQRVAAGLTGAAAVGAGSVATVLDGTNVGGAAVMLAVGAAFGYVGITGQPLVSLKIGDNQFALGRVVDHILQDPDISDDAKTDAAQVIEESQIALPSSAQRQVEQVLDEGQRGALYARLVRSTIDRVAPAGVSILEQPDDGPWDLLLRDPADTLIPVALKRTRYPLPMRIIFELSERLSSGATLRDGIVIAEQPPVGLASPSVDAIRDLTSAFSLRIAGWRGPEDDEALANVLGAAFEEARSRVSGDS